MIFLIYRRLFFFALVISAFLHLATSCLCAIESYRVHFEGHLSEEIKQLLRASSQMIALEKSPPSTAAALRRRAEADIPHFAKALQTMAYYDVHVDLNIELHEDTAEVIFTVDPGHLFKFQSFLLQASEESNKEALQHISLKEIDVQLGSIAIPQSIIDAEEAILKTMAYRSYPLAHIVKREVAADVTTYAIHVTLTIDSGPRAFFGKTSINGNKRVSLAFFDKKIAWCEGDLFSPNLVERTQHAMEASALFSSIAITPASAVEADQMLPMRIDVVESKHRSFGFGAGLSTQYGLGTLGEFENRNMRNRGEKLTFKTTLWRHSYQGLLFYLMPDWLYRDQDLLWLAEAGHEKTKSYTESSLSGSIIIEQHVSERLRTSWGIKGELLRNTNSDNDGDFNLLKLPVSVKWLNVDDPFDPKSGYALNYKGIPTLQVLHNRFAYCVNLLIASAYVPLDKDQKHILALKCTLGSILGATRRTIPPSERFYAGSEETLRGYRYQTVSPLDRDHNPIGGRSIMIYNLEWRWRMNQQIGWVLFYDIGNVYKSYLPEINHQQKQSLGLGLRFHTPVGPLRLDVAFPLEPRRHIDHRFEIYLSMGQTF